MISSLEDTKAFVEAQFAAGGIALCDHEVREYPQETIFVIEVRPEDFGAAVDIASDVDRRLAERNFLGFVTVKRSSISPTARDDTLGALENGVHDSRAAELVKLLVARSRASETQPSLSYVRDVSANIASVLTARHHLIFGRRGAGKTALMAEAKRLAEERGDLTLWINIQTYRQEQYLRVYLWVVRRLCDLVVLRFKSAATRPHVLEAAERAIPRISDILGAVDTPAEATRRLVPEIQEVVRRFLEATACRLFILLDDFHYLSLTEQPLLLDMLHGSVRDTDAWLKIAAIRHLSRWYQAHPPIGLQTGQDADHIDLDVTLADPARAKSFLEQVLRRYANHAKIPGLSGVFEARALDRLVLASGAVPRDYLVLCGGSVEAAQGRERAKLVGIQDVNRAAGGRAKLKLSELEDDAASAQGSAQRILNGLQIVRAFCLDDKQFTFFRIDFKGKEAHPEEYSVLSALMDVRLLHMINASVSDERKAGERSEVFMLDLSQFTGERLRMKLRVLDFVRGHIVFRETGRLDSDRVADTSRRLLAVLRRAPLFDLKTLSATVAQSSPT